MSLFDALDTSRTVVILVLLNVLAASEYSNLLDFRVFVAAVVVAPFGNFIKS